MVSRSVRPNLWGGADLASAGSRAAGQTTACLIWSARFGRIRPNTRGAGYFEIRFPPELPIGLGATSMTGLKQAVGLRKSFEAAFPGALPQAGMRDAFGVVLTGASRNVQTLGEGVSPAPTTRGRQTRRLPYSQVHGEGAR